VKARPRIISGLLTIRELVGPVNTSALTRAILRLAIPGKISFCR